MGDWVKIHRKLKDSDLWLAEPFTRGQAWADLILCARWKPGHMRVRGVKVDLGRGQVGWSEGGLAKRWQWSRGKVRRFLKELEEEQQIVQQKTNITTLITIINYENYQGSDTTEKTADDTADGLQTEQQTDTKEEGEEGKEGEEGEEGLSLSNDKSSNSAESDPLSPSSNGVPLKKIAQAWNQALEANQGAMPKLMKIQPNTQRYRHIRARWKENPDLDTWQTLVAKAAKSSFLNGDNAKGWMASFDWLVKSKDNFLKCLEGNYDDKGASNAEPF